VSGSAADDDESSERASEPTIPAASERMTIPLVDGPHPALLPPDRLLAQCDLRTQRRSGPGGQHRNKTSSGVFLCHQPSGITAEATERRSQADNRQIALQRLRFRLAVQCRTSSVLDGKVPAEESEFRHRFYGTSLKIGDRNEAKPAVLALLLNDLHAAGGQPSAVAAQWQTSTSSIVRLIKSHPPAITLLNAIRGHHGRGPLK
jgi:hypothetical protein